MPISPSRRCVAALVVSTACGAAPASVHAAVVRDLEGSGKWTIAQDYGGGAGIVFVEDFAFRALGHPALAPPGRTTKVRLRVTVDAHAFGAFMDLRTDPAHLVNYSCSGRHVSRATASIRRLTAQRLNVVALRTLDPGDPPCSVDAGVTWPFGDRWFARTMTVRASPAPRAPFIPAPLSKDRKRDCGSPEQVGTCTEMLAWEGLIQLAAR